MTNDARGGTTQREFSLAENRRAIFIVGLDPPGVNPGPRAHQARGSSVYPNKGVSGYPHEG